MAPINTSTQLTARQAQILGRSGAASNDTGYPPTQADIAAELGFKSTNAMKTPSKRWRVKAPSK